MSGLWWASYTVLWLLTLAVAVVLISVLRSLGGVYAMLEGAPSGAHGPRSKLRTGDLLPGVKWEALSGEGQVVPEPTGTKQAFVVVSPNCGPCVDYLRYVNEEPGRVDPLDPSVEDWLIVSLGDAEDTMGLLRRAGVTDNSRVVLDLRGAVSRVWGVAGTPLTVIVDEELRVVRQTFGADHRHPNASDTAAQQVMHGSEIVSQAMEELANNGSS